MSQVVQVDHPLIQHKLSYLRDTRASTGDFRRLVLELTALLTYEATKDLRTETVRVETPLAWTEVERVSGKKVAGCPVLRAGVGMLDGFLGLVSGARVGFVGLFRDEETLEPVSLVKLPSDLGVRDAIVLDPMLATGNSLCGGHHGGQERRRALGPGDLPRGRAGGIVRVQGGAFQRRHLHHGNRPRAERPRLHRPGIRGRRRPPLRDEVISRRSMWQTLRNNPEVLWGFLLALVVVLVLTPAVGRFAASSASWTSRVRGGASICGPVPRLGGIALLLGIFVPALAFLTAGRRLPGHPARRRGRDLRRRRRRLPRAAVVGEARGPGPAAAMAVGFGVHVERFTFPFLGRPDAAGLGRHPGPSSGSSRS